MFGNCGRLLILKAVCYIVRFILYTFLMTFERFNAESLKHLRLRKWRCNLEAKYFFHILPSFLLTLSFFDVKMHKVFQVSEFQVCHSTFILDWQVFLGIIIIRAGLASLLFDRVTETLVSIPTTCHFHRVIVMGSSIFFWS